MVSVEDEVARIEDNIKPQEKAKAKARSARSRSDDVETARPPTAQSTARSSNDNDIVLPGNVTLNNNADRQYWNEASANEIKNQLTLRRVPVDQWEGKSRPQLIALITRIIRESRRRR